MPGGSRGRKRSKGMVGRGADAGRYTRGFLISTPEFIIAENRVFCTNNLNTAGDR
jgi:hypothetical protein